MHASDSEESKTSVDENYTSPSAIGRYSHKPPCTWMPLNTLVVNTLFPSAGSSRPARHGGSAGDSGGAGAARGEGATGVNGLHAAVGEWATTWYHQYWGQGVWGGGEVSLRSLLWACKHVLQDIRLFQGVQKQSVLGLSWQILRADDNLQRNFRVRHKYLQSLETFIMIWKLIDL